MSGIGLQQVYGDNHDTEEEQSYNFKQHIKYLIHTNIINSKISKPHLLRFNG